MTKIYKDGTYLKNNPSWHEQDSPWKALQIRNIIERNSLDPVSICDVGCGAGEVLSQLSMHYNGSMKLFGYEISPQAFSLCSKKSKANLIFKLSDILEDDSAYFSIIMAIDVFEHITDYFGFLKKLKEKAEYKIFHIPLDLSVQTILRSTPIINKRKYIGHLHYFTKETALETLKDTGYEIVDYLYTSGSMDIPNRGWRVGLLNIPRRIVSSINKDLAVRLLGGYSLLVLAR